MCLRAKYTKNDNILPGSLAAITTVEAQDICASTKNVADAHLRSAIGLTDVTQFGPAS